MNKFILSVLAITLSVFAASTATAAETKYATATNTARITFGPDRTSGGEITAVLAKSDKSTAAVKFYTTGGAGKLPITTASTSGALTVFFTNTGNAITTNDVVAYVHENGTVLGTTVSGNTSTSATLATGITLAGTTNDSIIEVTQQGQIDIGTTALQLAGYTIFAVPPGAPAMLVGDGNTNIVLTATKK